MKALLLAGTAAFFVVPAMAGGLGDWNINPYSTDVADWTVNVGGSAYGTLFSSNQPATGANTPWASGAATLTSSLKRTTDSGLSLSLNSAFEIYHDKLSGDNYGSAFVQKVYGIVQTGLGRVEIGNTDGAAYALAVTGPVVDDATSMDNANASYFIDPTTGRDFTRIFALNSAVESSLNYAKISYYTPRLFGVQIAASYTPSEGKDVLPFLASGSHFANRQHSIWEAALSYSDYLGPLSVGIYGGFAFGHAVAKTPGHAGLTDWGLGSEIDYNVNDDVKLSLGGAYRHANTYAFDINNALGGGETTSAHLSATLSYGPWLIGGEYGDGTADSLPATLKLGVRGYETSLGYVFNANLQATMGWQQLRYSRDVGSFYNGAPCIAMDAVFFHLKLHV
jgi:hypothetical protein